MVLQPPLLLLLLLAYTLCTEKCVRSSHEDRSRGLVLGVEGGRAGAGIPPATEGYGGVGRV